MRSSIRGFIALFFALVLSACQFDLSPIVSASVDRSEKGQPANSTELSSVQVRDLAAWFSQRKDGWSTSVVSYVPVSVIRVRHSDGDTTVVNVLSNAVVVYNRKGQFMRELRADDLPSLRAIMERKDG